MLGTFALCWAICGVVLGGCAGARVNVTAEHSRYPISMSPVIRDASSRSYDERSLQKVGRFLHEKTSLGIAYSVLTVPSTCDISDQVNLQVSAAGGEAVINLTVTVNGGCTVLNAFPFLNALPVWPGCIPLAVSGDIVRRPSRLPMEDPHGGHESKTIAE